MKEPRFKWYEFFAGGGMARLGLGGRWECMFANEWCEKKRSAYTATFGTGNPKRCNELNPNDVAKLTSKDLPGHPDLVWASFPCQDLSLAGNGAGLKGERSGTFKPFWRLMETLAIEQRAPRLIVLENVVGALTSHGGKDFTSIIRKLSDESYRVGAMTIDAVRFVPQSRPRLFIVAAREDLKVSSRVVTDGPTDWHSKALRGAYQKLPFSLRDHWVWWSLPSPPKMKTTLADLIENEPRGVEWHSREQTKYLISLMSEINRKKLAGARLERTRRVGTIYRRTRPTDDGEKTQRAEVRFDDVSGCLRTPVGGSSRQTIIVVDGEEVRSRLLSPREAATPGGLQP